MPKTSSAKSGSKPAAKKTAKKTDPITNDPSALLELFTDSIKDIYWAENQLVKALPKMQQAAASPALADAIANHLEETKVQVTRLEQVFELLGEKVQAKRCDAMLGLTKEGESVIEDTEEGTTARDTGIILASQKVEHYEIAAYTGLSKLATNLGLTEVADLLNATLAEEIQSDETLSAIADNEISYELSTEEA